MSMDNETIEQFKDSLPSTMKKSVNQQLIDTIDKTLSEPEMYETYRENLLSYTKVMQEGKFRTENYIFAVKYVSHKLSGKTNLDAFSVTFPDKIQRWTTQGVSSKDIASYVTAYNKSKLVNLIMEQTLIPSWILNQDLYQQALNQQAYLMINANSEKVQTDAANSLLTALKRPETQKVEMDIGVKEDGSIAALRETTMELSRMQRQAIEAGSMDAQEVAHQKLVIDGVSEEKENDQ